MEILKYNTILPKVVVESITFLLHVPKIPWFQLSLRKPHILTGDFSNSPEQLQEISRKSNLN
jgi:hypothetical protein